MKKVMFAAAAAASMLVMGAGVESAVVGYHTQQTTTRYPTVGCMFVIPGTGTFKLGDIVPSGLVYREDVLQVIDPTTSKISDIFTYYSEAGDEGWYVFNPGGANDDEAANDRTFSAGTAFLANLDISHNVSLTYAGEVLTGSVTIDTKDANGNYMRYPYIVNPLPKRINLQDVVPTGLGYREDFLQEIDPSTSKIANIYTYYSEAGDEGWYVYNPGGENDDAYAENVYFEIGCGFLGAFDTSHQVKLTFPAAY